MCDEQNRTLQNYLRKQPGKFDSVNLVVDVAELLHHIHRVCTLPQMRENEELRYVGSREGLVYILQVFIRGKTSLVPFF